LEKQPGRTARFVWGKHSTEKFMNKILVVGHKGQLGTDCMSVLGADAMGVDLPEIDIADRFQWVWTI